MFLHIMNLVRQIKSRQQSLGKTTREIAKLVGMAPSNATNSLAGKIDVRASTLEAFADALDAKWVLVPRHLLPEIERILSGKSIGPDDVPSAAQRFLNRGE
ncbi:helix-turn-helix domain-containing protein [Undibacterium sp.]|uniref:helix-turn-helix domain-containing protein n=1 Tax=Undibacterium sp. TaxID=1914977 RepID=UPI002B9FA3AE|nr:helix-turn-helix domain-containing protein [Undibacterium sp.]HTD04519.1 helix-turn-helix domain-containing protein [Undibacterium sp.]